MKKILLFIFISFLGISDFSIKNGKVYYEDKYGEKVVKKADSKTFEILPRKGFAKDKNHVYVGDYIIPDADPNTFELLSGCYSKDKNYVYCTDGKLRELNPDTVKIIGDYAYDNGIMYILFQRIEGIDIDSFEVLKGLYSKDKNSIYYVNKKIENVDMETFESFKNGYARDKNHVYLLGGIQKDLDPKTFEIPEKAVFIVN